MSECLLRGCGSRRTFSSAAVAAAVAFTWRTAWSAFRSCVPATVAAALIAASFAGPAFAILGAPSFTKVFTPNVVTVGGTTTLTFNMTNPNGGPLTGLTFTDTLPAGITIASPSGLTSTCGGVTAATFPSSISLSGGGLIAFGSCTISVNVTAISPGLDINATSTLTSNEAGSAPAATAILTIKALAPVLTQSFTPSAVLVGGTTTLSFTVSNPNPATTLTGVGFVDTLPAGVVVATPNGLTGSCGGGTITATSGGNSYSLGSATLAASASCTVSINMVATTVGSKFNTSSTVSSNEADPGSPATAALAVAGTTATGLVSSANPSSGGQAVTFTATVTGLSPTGIVTFKDGSTVLGTGTLASGVASFTTSSLSVGSHSITAVYAGDATNAPSTSAVLTQTVGPPVDSLKLRALQIAGTKIEAQSSGQAIAGAVEGAMSDAFSESNAPFSAGDNGMHFNFAAEPQADGQEKTSLEERMNKEFAALGYSRDPMLSKAPAARPAPKEWLAWVDVRGTGWNTSLQTGDIRGGQTNALLGLTRKVSPSFLVGVFGGFENFDYTSQVLAGRLKGSGWTGGGYFAWRFLPGVRFDGSVARSGVSYDGTAGTATGTFPGQRWFASAALVGTTKTAIGLEIEQSARIYALWEHEDAYTDSLGTAQSERTFTTGRGSAGSKFSYPWMWSATTTVAPYVGFFADYYFNKDDAVLPISPGLLLPTEFVAGWSGRVTSGLEVMFASGPKLSVGGEVGGLGSGQFTNWSVRGRGVVPF
jgi:uncharacterized repeat protein (TIGR01451 family)